MRTFAITGGPIDVRKSPTGSDICLVFESTDMQVRLFRTMSREEAEAFLAHAKRVMEESNG